MSEPQLAIPRHGSNGGQQAFADFRRAGVIAFDNLWPAATIAALRLSLEARHPEYLGKSDKAPLDKFDTGEKRFLSPVTFAPPFDSRELWLHPALHDFFTRTLGRKYVYEAIGVISSLPGADRQHLHSDGEGLFEEAGIDRLLPPVAMTMVIPLVKVDERSGMTALWPGSHLTPGVEVDENRYQAIELDLGSCMIWDFRTRHRGLANLSDEPRPLLYATLCRPFWVDWKNFEPGVNEKLLASRASLERLTEEERKHFARAKQVD